MENTFAFFDKTFHRDIYQDMLDNEKQQLLLQTLIQMQTEHGIRNQEAAEQAERCIEAVTGCESIRSALAEDTVSMVEQMLDYARKSEDAELALHKLYFGMAIYPDFVASTNRVTAEELFWRYYGENKGTKTLEELKQDIRDSLADYQLTPEVMQTLIMKMESSGDYLATAAALGEGGISFKCIAAMELYLKNRDAMTIEEAANLACAGVEIQAAANAVGQGLITRDVARKILIVAGITLVVVGMAMTLYYTGKLAGLSEVITPFVEDLPLIFEEFSESFETVFRYNNPLYPITKKKVVHGAIIIGLGTIVTTISQHTADLIGKFRIGFTTDKEPAKEGLQQLAAYREPMERPLAEHTEQWMIQEEKQQQPQPAILGIV